jgi:hypothetical protein
MNELKNEGIKKLRIKELRPKTACPPWREDRGPERGNEGMKREPNTKEL